MPARRQNYDAGFGTLALAILVMVLTGTVLGAGGHLTAMMARRGANRVTLPPRCEREITEGCANLAATVRAANASEDAADIALFQLGVGVLGLVGLAFTVVYAQRAWSAAFQQVELTQRSIAAEHRPWLSLSCTPDTPLEPGRTHLNVDGFYMGLRARSRNHGRAPATNISFHAELKLIGPKTGDIEQILRAFMEQVKDRGRGQGVTLFGEETTEDLGFMLFLPQPDIDSSMDRPIGKFIAPVIVGCLNYASDHAEGVCQTGFAATMSRIGQGGLAFAIDPTVPNWWQQQIAMNTPRTIIAT